MLYVSCAFLVVDGLILFYTATLQNKSKVQTLLFNVFVYTLLLCYIYNLKGDELRKGYLIHNILLTSFLNEWCNKKMPLLPYKVGRMVQVDFWFNMFEMASA